MYAIQQDLEERFGAAEIVQIADRDGDDVADPAVVARALEDADATINGYLESRYALPLNPVPRLIVKIACDLARFQLYEDLPTEAVQGRYADAIDTLEKISRGTIRLGLDAAEAPTADQSPGPVAEKGGGVFTDETLEGF